MRKCRYLCLSRRIRQCRIDKPAAPPAPVALEPKSGMLSAVEVIAFFTGVAIIFSLINTLFLQQFMQVNEFIYGLTFADESFSLKKISYIFAIPLVLASIMFAVLCDPRMRQPKKAQDNQSIFEKYKNSLSSLLQKYQQNTWQKISLLFIIILPVFLYIFCVYNKYISDDVIFFISAGCLFISSLIMVIFVKCTFPCRALLFFTILMILSWVYCSFNARSISKDIPVTITMQNGSTINALRCTISKEGIAILKESNSKQRMIPLSLILEITENTSSLQKPSANNNSESTKQEAGTNEKAATR